MIFYQLRNNLPTKLFAYSFSFSAKQPKNRQLPAYFDINVSLLSNIQKRKTFQQVFTLHKLMRSYYTPKHIAKSIRVLTQIIDKEQFQFRRAEKMENFKISTHHQEWRNFLNDMWQTKASILAAEDKLDFLHFIYKTAQYRISLKTLKPDFGIQLVKFRKSLISNIINPSSIKDFTIQQLAVILYYFKVIREQKKQIIAVLDQIKQQLKQNVSCVPLHLILINKTLRDIQKMENCFLDQNETNDLKKVLANYMAPQIPHILEYIDMVALVQIYNVVSCYHPGLVQPMVQRAKDLLPELRKKTYHYTFLTQELPLFQKDLEARSEVFDITKELLQAVKELIASSAKIRFNSSASKSQLLNKID